MKKYYVSSTISLVLVVLVFVSFVFSKVSDDSIARNRKPEIITGLSELSELCKWTGSAGKSAFTDLDYDKENSFKSGTLHISVINNSSRKAKSPELVKQNHYSDIRAYIEDDEFYCDVEGVFSLYIEDDYVTCIFIVDYSMRLYSDDDVSVFVFDRFNMSMDASEDSRFCPETIRNQITIMNQLNSDITNHYTEWTSLDALDSIFSSEIGYCFELVGQIGSAFSEENADDFFSYDSMPLMRSYAFTDFLRNELGYPVDSGNDDYGKLFASLISPTEPSVETEISIADSLYNVNYTMKIDFSHINQTNVYQVENESITDYISSAENKGAEE